MYTLQIFKSYFSQYCKNWDSNDRLGKNLCRMAFWTSILFGLIIMTYSSNKPTEHLSPMFNLKKVENAMLGEIGPVYQAQVTCSGSFLINILNQCHTDSWIIPPICPILNGENAEQIYSWGPVVFSCDNREFLRPFTKYNYDTPTREFYWNIGAFLFFAPIFLLCGMFASIGIFQYTKRRQDENFNVADKVNIKSHYNNTFHELI